MEGDWSDNSSKWTARMKSRLSWVSRDDGIFWMCLDDFIVHFAGLGDEGKDSACLMTTFSSTLDSVHLLLFVKLLGFSFSERIHTSHQSFRACGF